MDLTPASASLHPQGDDGALALRIQAKGLVVLDCLGGVATAVALPRGSEALRQLMSTVMLRFSRGGVAAKGLAAVDQALADDETPGTHCADGVSCVRERWESRPGNAGRAAGRSSALGRGGVAGCSRTVNAPSLPSLIPLLPSFIAVTFLRPSHNQPLLLHLPAHRHRSNHRLPPLHRLPLASVCRSTPSLRTTLIAHIRDALIPATPSEMQYSLVALGLAALAQALPQSSSGVPSGCKTSYSGSFEFDVVNVTAVSNKAKVRPRARLMTV